MVRINLLDDPLQFAGDKQTHEKEAVAEKPAQEDFSFDSMEKMFHPEESEAAAEVPAADAVPEIDESPGLDRHEESAGTSPDSGFYDEFGSTLPKKKMFVIGGIVAGVLILAISLYFIFSGSEKEPAAAQTGNVPANSAAKSPAGANTQALSGPFQTVLAENLDQNSRHLSFVNTLVGASAAGAGYSLIITSGKRAYFSILAKNRDEIAQFRIQLKKDFPDNVFTLESIQTKLVNGTPMLLADFGTSLKSLSGKARGARSVQAGNLTVANIRTVFNGIARKYNLRPKYFRKGYRVPSRLFTKNYYYATLSGKKNGILKFLGELNRSYPELNFAKISIYPANLSAIDNSTITARITFVLFSPAKS